MELDKEKNLNEIQYIKEQIYIMNKKVEKIERELINEETGTILTNSMRGKFLTLYIYADPVLFEQDALTVSLRSNALEFLEWAKKHFNCTIIFNRSVPEIQEAFNEFYLDEWLSEIKINHCGDNNKITDLIDPYADYYIISTESFRSPIFQTEDKNEHKRYIKLSKQPLDQAQIQLFERLFDIVNLKIRPFLKNVPDNISVYSRLGKDTSFYKDFTYGEQYETGYISFTIESEHYTFDTNYKLEYNYEGYKSNSINLYQTKGIEGLIEKMDEITKKILPVIPLVTFLISLRVADKKRKGLFRNSREYDFLR